MFISIWKLALPYQKISLKILKTVSICFLCWFHIADSFREFNLSGDFFDSFMEDRKEKNNAPWLSVPQFGDWDQKGPLPDYSLDFSKIREMRKQNKRDLSRASLGNEEELIPANTTNANTSHSDHHQFEHNSNSPTVRRSILRYFNCCAKA